MERDPRSFLWDARESAGRIPGLARAVAFRNLLIHGYATVDDPTVWRTTQEDLPGLRAVVAGLLAELGDFPGPETP